MAESGGIPGVLGAETGPSADGSVVESPLDPTAAALAAEAAKNDSALAKEATTYFRNQAHLVEIQTEHLHEQRAVNLSLLKLKRFGERLTVALRLFVILIATGIGLGGLVLLHDAVTSRRVVIEPFDVPSALASRGVTGKVVAAGLLGELNRLQAATKSSAAKRDLANAWSSEPELALPETGLSLGDLSRLLRRRFGRDLHVDGDLVQTEAADLELTVRGDGVPQKSFSGKADELARLTTQMAEYVYAQSEPALYATYLANEERFAETIRFSQAAYTAANPADRPYLLNAWAVALQSAGGSNRAALALFRAAVKLQPDFWVAHTNVQNTLMLLGEEEGAWRAGEDMRKAAGGRPGRAREYNYGNSDELTWNLRAWLDAVVTDAEQNAGAGTGTNAAGPQIADIQARLHDAEAADLALRTTKEDPHDPTIAAITHFVQGWLAADAGDIARAAAEMESFDAASTNPAVSLNYPGYSCWVAPAAEAAGHTAKADAVLKTAGTFVDCYRFRGDILDHRGNWTGAQQAYADAVALAPDLPAAYYSWGVALGRHGEFAGAIEKLRDANQRGPHWADPLKAWGDVLAKQGKRDEAHRKYDEALKYAPQWQQLKEARDALAKRAT
jgi:tetratricopeptide (TPR) repeat protein